MKRIYLDHSATTPVHPQVAELMVEYMTGKFGNPSSVHSFGREVKKSVEEARGQLASLMGANQDEIVFTSGGTEADNMAIIGAALANNKKGNHIITTSIEHHAILDSCAYLEKQGFNITYLPVDEEGFVKVADVAQAITPETILISVMHANNEVGSIQPLREIGKIAKENNILFHTDAVQSLGKVPVDVQELQLDLLSASSHKIYGPKGIGCLYIRKGVKLSRLSHGGGQERRRRAGTENVPGIVGFGLAAQLAQENMDSEQQRLTTLRDKLIEEIPGLIPHVKLNGPKEQRMPNNVNFSFLYVEGESLLLSLDMKGIAASSGSACTSGSLDPSHVLLAMGLSHEVAHGSLRLTLGKDNTQEDVDIILKELPVIIERLRAMSPLYNAK